MTPFVITYEMLNDQTSVYYDLDPDLLLDLGFVQTETGFQYNGTWTDSDGNGIPDFLQDLLTVTVTERPSQNTIGG